MRIQPFTRTAAVLAMAAILVLATIGVANAGVSRAWTHQFGRTGTDITHGVAVDRERNVFVAGYMATDRLDDCFVRKYLPDGRRRWMRVFGTSANDTCQGMAVARNGSVYVVGYTRGTLAGTSAGNDDAFVRKYRADGSVAWTRQFGTAFADRATAVTVDDGGNVLVAGHTTGDLDGNGNRGQWDGFVRKLRSSGRPVWTRQFGTSVNDWISAVAVDPSRRIVVAGETYGSLGALYRGSGDAYVRKYRPNGDHMWTWQVGTLAREWSSGLAINASGRIYVVGRTAGALPGQVSHGGWDGFVSKLKPDGDTAWTRQFGTPGDDEASDVTVDGAGRIYVAGRLSVGAYDAIVMKLRSNGAMAWVKKSGSGSSSEDGRDVAVDKKKHVYLVGTTSGSLAGQTWAGSVDAWIRKYKP